jgi:hypothetical protein
VRFSVDASITVEVLIGAPDRFGCKIVAMIRWPSHLRAYGASRRAWARYDALWRWPRISSWAGAARRGQACMHPGGWPLSERGRKW